ncbi:glycoside hydrolase family 16 protein [Laccaria amethystina LaAM-08-1]|uniref:Unplaced genomic scaffold K443scaffold_163, whole genome shotgun sequence n=1 Tax=Laccaria amethystina LaAM-08-1 TaxID=1095629 RepID=A0A0C9WX46_9AGAR|nr:glycoside hydrolase family 16 protein [Laccaria amethystina LaAM-08-1]
MAMGALTKLLLFLAASLEIRALYYPLREYSGSTFFDKWDYYGFVDNTTWGNVTYQDQANATSKGLTFINAAGNAIIKVDNTTTLAAAPPGTVVNRDSIRITSQDAYPLGTLILLDTLHIPYGCSVWPSFWTLGLQSTWPGSGEIDIVEAINGMTRNQIALHTPEGCNQDNTVQTPASQLQSGTTANTDCAQPRGCIVMENKEASFGAAFGERGGGVYAMSMEQEGVYVWFWSRADVPSSITTATSTSTMDTTSWGLPTAAYPASGCNITQYFPPQNLVLLTTLCGVWAGVPSIYSSTCPGTCFADNVLGSGANYANAYWEIRYIRTYASDASLPVSVGSAASSTQGGGTTVVTVVTAAAGPTSGSGRTSGALRVEVLGKGRGVVFVVLLLGFLV